MGGLADAGAAVLQPKLPAHPSGVLALALEVLAAWEGLGALLGLGPRTEGVLPLATAAGSACCPALPLPAAVAAPRGTDRGVLLVPLPGPVPCTALCTAPEEILTPGLARCGKPGVLCCGVVPVEPGGAERLRMTVAMAVGG